MKDIGKNIKSIRQTKGMTQNDLANALYVTTFLFFLVRLFQVLGLNRHQIFLGGLLHKGHAV